MVYSYFTAGVLVVLGIILLIAYGKETKVVIPAGIVFILLGIWWGISTYFPDNSIINGWVGWVIKIAAGVVLVGLLAYFILVQRREKAKFRAEQEAAKRAEAGEPEQPAPKRQSLYETYDDYEYEDEAPEQAEQEKEQRK